MNDKITTAERSEGCDLCGELGVYHNPSGEWVPCLCGGGA